MATKWKSFRYDMRLRAAAWVLALAAAAGGLFLLRGMDEKAFDWDRLRRPAYAFTEEFQRELWELQSCVSTILCYQSERNIRDGKTLNQRDIDEEIQRLFNSVRYDLEQKLLNQGAVDEESQKLLWELFQRDYASEIADVRDTLTARQLDAFRVSVAKLTNWTGIVYAVQTDEGTLSNTAQSPEEILENYTDAYNPEFGNYHVYLPDGNAVRVSLESAAAAGRGAFAFNQAYMDARNAEFLLLKQKMERGLLCGGGLLLAFLFGVGVLVSAAGRRAGEPSGVRLWGVDRLYSEFTLALWGLLLLGGLYALAFSLAEARRPGSGLPLWAGLPLWMGAAALWVAVTLMLARRLKDRSLLRHSLVYALLVRPLKRIYDLGPAAVKIALAILALGLLTLIPGFFLLTIPLAVGLACRLTRGYAAVKSGAARIREGSYDRPIPAKGTGELALLAGDLNDIAQGLGREVERRLKSERLRTELIVNVSHDLRTPLTSVITYADLLCQEDIQNENARRYIDVIAQKAGRLKTLTDDLFEAAKAASGNVAVHWEAVDLGALVTQGLGELDDRVEASGLDFRVRLPEAPLAARADGRLLWRALENLLSNVFKYALPGSRVYLDVFPEGDWACVELKNISAQELNIPADELLERLTRGDASRHSEGSGLGLDIARSLMRCQQGDLTLQIDGDLFKARLWAARPR